jgi:hypothetical protein
MSALCGRRIDKNILIMFLSNYKRHYQNAAVVVLLKYLKYNRSSSSKVLATRGEEATI